MRQLLDKVHINMKVLRTFARAFPSMGESLNTLNDPYELHRAVHDMIQFLEKGLELDHASGIAGEDLCLSVTVTEAGEEGTESVPSWSDGYGEVDADGSVDGGIPSSVFGTETTSPSLDL